MRTPYAHMIIYWRLLSNQIFNWNRCGNELLQLVTFSRHNSIQPSCSCSSIWGMQLLCVSAMAFSNRAEVSHSYFPIHPHFMSDTQILQGSPAHPHRTVTRIWLGCAKCWSFPLIQSATARDSHLYVGCWRFCDQQKVCLITGSFPSEAPDHLIFRGQRSNCSCVFLILWF